MTTADKGITSRFLSSLTGAVRRTIQSVLEDTVDVKHFGAKCDGVTDDTAAWNLAIAACSSNTQGAVKILRFRGKSVISSTLTLNKEFVAIEGDGPYHSQLICNGVTPSVIAVSGNYIRPILRNFSIIGNAATGHGIDLSGITLQCYLGDISMMTIYCGGACIKAPGKSGAPQFFSMNVSNVAGYSYNNHAFHIWSGPGNTFQSMYALYAPSGKAGYRMAGSITLRSCNGLNDGDVWGAFGSNTSGTDGFQSDFSGTDYVDLNLIGCNVERFGSLTTNGIGLRICNIYRNVNIIGGTLQRADADIPQGVGSYKALISAEYGSNQTGNPIKIGFSAIYLRDVINGTGTNTPSLAHFWAAFGTAQFEDTSGIANSVNIVGYTVNADGPLVYPIPRVPIVGDQYSGAAHGHIALSPRRISFQTTRYNLGSVLTPVGSNQTIDVTGRSKVIVTPAAAATVNKATFTSTVSNAATDYLRNGELVIEAGNANLTLVHTASGADVFVNKSGANYTLVSGEIRRYMRSETNGNWREVG